MTLFEQARLFILLLGYAARRQSISVIRDKSPTDMMLVGLLPRPQLNSLTDIVHLLFRRTTGSTPVYPDTYTSKKISRQL
jgi:hypothetical protein